MLLTFAKAKNDKIALKFYQMRVMDFLVREIGLEYEVEQQREKYFIITEGGKDTEAHSPPEVEPAYIVRIVIDVRSTVIRRAGRRGRARSPSLHSPRTSLTTTTVLRRQKGDRK
jgi:hypothetical protein